MEFLKTFHVWDNDGEEHTLEIDFCCGRYTVMLDNMFYCTAEHYRQARDEISGIIERRKWSFRNPKGGCYG